MNLTLKLKLAPTVDQHRKLLETMERFNEACNYISEIAFAAESKSKVNLQKTVYYPVREKFGLSAQMAVRAISKVCESYRTTKDPEKPLKFKEHGAMVYDQRILSWKGLDNASILTLEGRELVKIVMCDYHRSRLDRIRGQADLIFINGVFYLCAVVDCAEPELIKPTEALGIDLGIVNLAADSDGELFSGEAVERSRVRYSKMKASLQSKGTKSAKRKLKRNSGREVRFKRDVNHCISKAIVTKAHDTGRGIALEQLKGIRNQTTVRKAQRGRHGKWAFYQLREFIEYKAALMGVPVFPVDPAYTSQTCPVCGTVDKKNRTRQSFSCIGCGFAGHADNVAAINIAARANVNKPNVSATHALHPQGQAPTL